MYIKYSIMYNFIDAKHKTSSPVRGSYLSHPFCNSSVVRSFFRSAQLILVLLIVKYWLRPNRLTRPLLPSSIYRSLFYPLFNWTPGKTIERDTPRLLNITHHGRSYFSIKDKPCFGIGMKIRPVLVNRRALFSTCSLRFCECFFSRFRLVPEVIPLTLGRSAATQRYVPCSTRDGPFIFPRTRVRLSPRRRTRKLLRYKRVTIAPGGKPARTLRKAPRV